MILFAYINETLIGAIALAVGGIIGACANAYINWRKAKAEIARQEKKDVIDGWIEITNRQQIEIAACNQALVVQSDAMAAMKDKMQKEIDGLRQELASLRQNIAAREVERVEQRTDIRRLETKVAEVSHPDATAIAEAIAPKVAEAVAPKVVEALKQKPDQ